MENGELAISNGGEACDGTNFGENEILTRSHGFAGIKWRIENFQLITDNDQLKMELLL